MSSKTGKSQKKGGGNAKSGGERRSSRTQRASTKSGATKRKRSDSREFSDSSSGPINPSRKRVQPFMPQEAAQVFGQLHGSTVTPMVDGSAETSTKSRAPTGKVADNGQSANGLSSDAFFTQATGPSERKSAAPAESSPNKPFDSEGSDALSMECHEDLDPLLALKPGQAANGSSQPKRYGSGAQTKSPGKPKPQLQPLQLNGGRNMQTMQTQPEAAAAQERGSSPLRKKFCIRGAREEKGEPQQQRQFLRPLREVLTTAVDDEMVEFMMERERPYQPEPYYMERQQHIDGGMRAILFSWLQEVSQEYCLGRETLQMATNMVDRFLSLNPHPEEVARQAQRKAAEAAHAAGRGPPPSEQASATEHKTPASRGSGGQQVLDLTGDESDSDSGMSGQGREGGTRRASRKQKRSPYYAIQDMLTPTGSVVITRANLQLLGVTCLFIAAKAEEIYPPNGRDFAVTTDGAYSISQIACMEQRVLHSLGWNLMPQTPYSWLKMFVQMTAKHLYDERMPRSSASSSFLAVDTALSYAFANAGPTVEELLDVNNFTRMCEVLDVALLDIWFLRFYPSAMAASVFALLFVYERALLDKSVIKHITGYDIDQLVQCIAVLREFLKLPFRGIIMPQKPYFQDLKIPLEDMYTRQMHHPEGLTTLNSLPTGVYEMAGQICTDEHLRRAHYPHTLKAPSSILGGSGSHSQSSGSHSGAAGMQLEHKEGANCDAELELEEDQPGLASPQRTTALRTPGHQPGTPFSLTMTPPLTQLSSSSGSNSSGSSGGSNGSRSSSGSNSANRRKRLVMQTTGDAVAMMEDEAETDSDDSTDLR